MLDRRHAIIGPGVHSFQAQISTIESHMPVGACSQIEDVHPTRIAGGLRVVRGSEVQDLLPCFDPFPSRHCSIGRDRTVHATARDVDELEFVVVDREERSIVWGKTQASRPEQGGWAEPAGLPTSRADQIDSGLAVVAGKDAPKGDQLSVM
jgi:hypothetical protein